MKVPYFVPWITKEDKNAVVKGLSDRWLTNGPNLKKFENGICNFLKSKYALGVGSATQALHLSLRSMGIKSGDEVIVPSFTFVATANAVKYCNAKPILTDVDKETFNIIPSEIKGKITKKTKAIIVVHYGGQSCDMKEIMEIAQKKKIPVIEDCAHAFGSQYRKKFCGNFGKAGCFSFYPTKIITTGEGGAVTTNDFKIAKKVKLLRSQGMDISPKEREQEDEWRYDVIDLGYNYRLDEIRASLGCSQLKRVKLINKNRIKIAKLYDKELKNIKGITMPHTKPGRNHIYHLYTIKVDGYHLSRDQLFKKLSKNGVGTSVQFYPIHLMSLYKDEYKSKTNQFPNSNILKDQVISLPIFPTMTKKQVEKVVSLIK